MSKSPKADILSLKDKLDEYKGLKPRRNQFLMTLYKALEVENSSLR